MDPADLNQPCPAPDCAEEGCALYACCPGRGCDCPQSVVDDSYSRVVDYRDDGDVIRYCGEHKTEWIADR